MKMKRIDAIYDRVLSGQHFSPCLKRVKRLLPKLMDNNINLCNKLNDKLRVSSFINDTELRNQKYLRNYVNSSDNYLRQIKSGFMLNKVIKQNIPKISILSEQISNDWVSYPPTDEEYSKADQNSGRVKALYEIEQPNLSRAYGCTLICAVRTSEFWFAFHLGDGKCIAFNDDGSWFEPIPWDSRCFLNKATSLSGQGYESFRYCYGTRQVPALFIGSDGREDSYPPISCLADWYKLILYKILEHDSTKVQDMIVDFLPKLSKQGSKDDMSLQLWVDMDSLSTLCHNIYNKDINEKEQYCEQLSNEISNLKTDIFICSNNIDECNKEQIKLSEEKNKKKSFVESLVNAIHYLKKQLTQKEQQLSAENKELSALENNILVVSQKLSKLNSELEHTKKEIDRKEKEQNKTKDEIDTLKKLMSNINEKVNDHKCDIKYTI